MGSGEQLPFRGGRFAVGVHSDENEFSGGREAPGAGLRMFGPKLYLDGDRGPADVHHPGDGLDKLPYVDRLLEVDAVDRGSNHRLAATTHRSDAPDHVHHRKRLAAKEGAVGIGLLGEYYFGAAFDDVFVDGHDRSLVSQRTRERLSVLCRSSSFQLSTAR